MLGGVFKWFGSLPLIASFSGRVPQVLRYLLVGIIAGSIIYRSHDSLIFLLLKLLITVLMHKHL